MTHSNQQLFNKGDKVVIVSPAGVLINKEKKLP